MMTKQAKLKTQAYAGTLKSRALSVLIYLIDRSNKELTCFPAISTMAEQLHISVSTVKRALHELIDSGYIKKEFRFREKSRGQTSNLYTLVLFENETIPERDNNDVSGESGNCDESTEEINGNREGQTECKVEHINFDTLMTQKKESEKMAETREEDGGRESGDIVAFQEESSDETCICERGRGSVLHPLELSRLTDLKKRKSKYYIQITIAVPCITLLDEYDTIMQDVMWSVLRSMAAAMRSINSG